jgi:hypothetical protein
MSWRGVAAELATKVADYHKELVTTSVRFEELRRQTTEIMGEFKSVVLRLHEQVHAQELRHIQEIAQLNAQIGGLQDRLTMLSEKALHVTLQEMAREKLAMTPTDPVQKQFPQP